MSARSRSLIATYSGYWSVFVLAVGMLSMAGAAAQAAEQEVLVTFSGGHELERKKDFGRPCNLIAAGLGVSPDVFREAFSGVTPSRDGPPSPEHARANKQALMKVLSPHGVTNERMDEVANYYRFQARKGELWRNTPAKAHAIVEDGKIKKIVVTEPGAGYNTPPTATLAGMDEIPLTVTLHYGKDLAKNGSVSSIDVAPESSSSSK